MKVNVILPALTEATGLPASIAATPRQLQTSPPLGRDE
jgi:hypothetical protein